MTNNWQCLCYYVNLFIGMPFYQAVHILKKQDTIIKGIQIWYSEQVSILLYL